MTIFREPLKFIRSVEKGPLCLRLISIDKMIIYDVLFPYDHDENWRYLLHRLIKLTKTFSVYPKRKMNKQNLL